MKYDSEREARVYTIQIFNKDLCESIIRSDTDHPHDSLDFCVKKIGLDRLEKTNSELLREFDKFKLILDERLKAKYAFLLTLEKEAGKMLFHISIISSDFNFRSGVML